MTGLGGFLNARNKKENIEKRRTRTEDGCEVVINAFGGGLDVTERMKNFLYLAFVCCTFHLLFHTAIERKTYKSQEGKVLISTNYYFFITILNMDKFFLICLNRLT